jgi:hypothetical protein
MEMFAGPRPFPLVRYRYNTTYRSTAERAHSEVEQIFKPRVLQQSLRQNRCVVGKLAGELRACNMTLAV